MKFQLAPIVALSVVPAAFATVFNQALRRDTTDICADVDADLDILGITLGPLDLCICLDGIPDLLGTNLVLEAAVDIFGEPTVAAAVQALVTATPGAKTCDYPPHSVPICEAGNPCGYECTDGFVRNPQNGECVCPGPSIVCNGKCVSAKACPSSYPKKRDAIQKRATCDNGLTACGTYGWSGLHSSEAWECVDTASDLESCGGCAVPLHRSSPRGYDCTSIPGVSDVSCSAGTCFVHRCLPGYEVSLDGSFCLRTRAMKDLEGDMSAAAYGLEHVPFKA